MIKEITASETLKVRNLVLRKGKNVETCYFDGDNLDTTKHFGYLVNNVLVGIASIYKSKNSAFYMENQTQLRGMAVLEEFQKLGFGEKLVKCCEECAVNNKSNFIWFNARINAVPFYEKLGYEKSGTFFEIADVGQHVVMFKLLVD